MQIRVTNCKDNRRQKFCLLCYFSVADPKHKFRIRCRIRLRTRCAKVQDSSGSATLLFHVDIIFQAVRTGVEPTIVVPTDNHYKTVCKKRPAPPMEELLENREKRSRFAKQPSRTLLDLQPSMHELFLVNQSLSNSLFATLLQRLLFILKICSNFFYFQFPLLNFRTLPYNHGFFLLVRIRGTAGEAADTILDFFVSPHPRYGR